MCSTPSFARIAEYYPMLALTLAFELITPSLEELSTFKAIESWYKNQSYGFKDVHNKLFLFNTYNKDYNTSPQCTHVLDESKWYINLKIIKLDRAIYKIIKLDNTFDINEMKRYVAENTNLYISTNIKVAKKYNPIISQNVMKYINEEKEFDGFLPEINVHSISLSGSNSSTSSDQTTTDDDQSSVSPAEQNRREKAQKAIDHKEEFSKIKKSHKKIQSNIKANNLTIMHTPSAPKAINHPSNNNYFHSLSESDDDSSSQEESEAEYNEARVLVKDNEVRCHVCNRLTEYQKQFAQPKYICCAMCLNCQQNERQCSKCFIQSFPGMALESWSLDHGFPFCHGLSFKGYYSDNELCVLTYDGYNYISYKGVYARTLHDEQENVISSYLESKQKPFVSVENVPVDSVVLDNVLRNYRSVSQSSISNVQTIMRILNNAMGKTHEYMQSFMDLNFKDKFASAVFCLFEEHQYNYQREITQRLKTTAVERIEFANAMGELGGSSTLFDVFTSGVDTIRPGFSTRINPLLRTINANPRLRVLKSKMHNFSMDAYEYWQQLSTDIPPQPFEPREGVKVTSPTLNKTMDVSSAMEHMTTNIETRNLSKFSNFKVFNPQVYKPANTNNTCMSALSRIFSKPPNSNYNVVSQNFSKNFQELPFLYSLETMDNIDYDEELTKQWINSRPDSQKRSLYKNALNNFQMRGNNTVRIEKKFQIKADEFLFKLKARGIVNVGSEPAALTGECIERLSNRIKNILHGDDKNPFFSSLSYQISLAQSRNEHIFCLCTRSG